MFKAEGIKPVRIGPRRPNQNAIAERYVTAKPARSVAVSRRRFSPTARIRIVSLSPTAHRGFNGHVRLKFSMPKATEELKYEGLERRLGILTLRGLRQG